MGGRMNYDDHLTCFPSDLEAMAAAAAAAGSRAPVPTCPDWNVADLLIHTAQVHHWARMNVERADPTRRTRRREVPTLPDPDRSLEWFSAGGERLLGVLEAGPANRAVWTWAPPSEAQFWARRVQHETAIHRVDAELAAGRSPAPFDPANALDGVDEVLANMPYRPSGAIPHGSGETLHFHATDGPTGGNAGEWLVRLTPEGPSVSREHAKGDVAVRGPVSGLFLSLWGRDPRAELEVFGDEELLGRFRAESTV